MSWRRGAGHAFDRRVDGGADRAAARDPGPSVASPRVASAHHEGRHPRRRLRHAAPSADPDHEQAPAAAVRPADGHLRGRGARRRGHRRADARHRRDARRRVLPPARERARLRDRPAALRVPGAGRRDRRGARPRRAVRRPRQGLRHARRQRLRRLAEADRGQLRGAEVRRPRRPLAGRRGRAPAPSRRRRDGRRPGDEDRGEARHAAEPVRGHRRLLLRRAGVGRGADVEAVRPRRARDHRREQLVRRARRDGGGRRRRGSGATPASRSTPTTR